jgi:hypothetical protein
LLGSLTLTCGGSEPRYVRLGRPRTAPTQPKNSRKATKGLLRGSKEKNPRFDFNVGIEDIFKTQKVALPAKTNPVPRYTRFTDQPGSFTNLVQR